MESGGKKVHSEPFDRPFNQVNKKLFNVSTFLVIYVFLQPFAFLIDYYFFKSLFHVRILKDRAVTGALQTV